MNKVTAGLTIAIIGIVLLVGCMIYYEQTYQLDEWMDEHPDSIPDIGAPPRLDLMLAVVIGLAIPIFIILKLSPKDDKKQDK